jgi:hypothetical protein
MSDHQPSGYGLLEQEILGQFQNEPTAAPGSEQVAIATIEEIKPEPDEAASAMPESAPEPAPVQVPAPVLAPVAVKAPRKQLSLSFLTGKPKPASEATPANASISALGPKVAAAPVAPPSATTRTPEATPRPAPAAPRFLQEQSGQKVRKDARGPAPHLGLAKPVISIRAALLTLVPAICVSFVAGQHYDQLHSRPATGDQQQISAAAPAFGNAIAVAATASTPASAASEAPATPASQPVPAAVLAAASGALPPVGSLPPAVADESDDHRQAQNSKAAPQPQAQPGKANGQTPYQQQKDGLIALAADPAPAPPPAAPEARAEKPPEPKKAAAPEKVAKVPANDATDGEGTTEVRRLKYGSMGITALTPNSVVLVNGSKGQTAILKGMTLPDGSIVKSVDAKNHRIQTNRGVIQLY